MEEKVLHCNLAGNKYSGCVRVDTLGLRSLTGASGSYTWESGVQYHGSFVDSEAHGRGRITWPDGSSYEGEVAHGLRHGHGVFTAADAVTRYEGQWQRGLRHGHGCLIYSSGGDAYYRGQWLQGQKDGQGRQVWPSGNTYDGQWKKGHMAGHGTMTWKDDDLVEQYSGNWETSNPDGYGSYTWFACESTLEPSLQAPSSQQMTNAYKGEWHAGARHGQGTFQYANGALYHGAWVDNNKEGRGRYTYEDGQIYSGPFEKDQMQADNSKMLSCANGRVLNVSDKDPVRLARVRKPEENPIWHCMDISDLAHTLLPVDVGPLSLEDGSGYDDEKGVMGEIYNLVLRHLVEVKGFYTAYRLLSPRPGADPFVLYNYQLWSFCRDRGFITPACSLSLLTRRATSGKRHHQEAAFEDLDQWAPLTPRASHQRPAEQDEEQPVTVEEVAHVEPSEHDQGPGNELDDCSASLDHQESMRETPENMQEALSKAEGAALSSPCHTLQDHLEAACGESAQGCEEPTGGDLPDEFEEPFQYPLFSHFWRKEGGPNLVDIYNPTGSILFRQFLESLVRLSFTRFPTEKCLLHRVRRALQECRVPNPATDKLPDTFAFLADKSIDEVFEKNKPALWHLFKANAVGEGAYSKPHWVGEALDEANEIGTNHPGTNRSSRSSASRTNRRGYGGQQRRVHLAARMDVTIRVKDVLKLFNNMGLLQPLKLCGDLPEAFNPEPVFPLPKQRDNWEQQGFEAKAQQRPEGHACRSRTASEGDAQEGGSSSSRARVPRTQQKVQTQSVGDGRRHQRTEGDEAVRKDPDACEAVLKQAVQDCFDMTISFLDLLSLLLEVCLPEETSKLLWSTRSSSISPEHVSLLDYLETELCYHEFLRILVRVADMQTGQDATIASFSLARRLDAFLRFIFLPALQQPYHARGNTPAPSAAPSGAPSAAPSAAPSKEPPEAAALTPVAPTPAPGKSPRKARQSVAAKATSLEPAPLPEPGGKAPEPPEFWQGFDDDLALDVGAMVTPRFWPPAYELDS